MTDLGLALPVPAPVMQVLAAAHAAETTARGSARRDAFRITRHLIAGCLLSGIRVEDLATALGVSASSVRMRGSSDGLVPTHSFAEFAGIDTETLADWHRLGMLPAAEPDDARRTGYPGSALIAVLLTNPPLALHATA